MKFERRDLLLIVGLLLFMIGLIPFMAPVYAVVIVTIMYFVIKVFVGKRRKSIQKDVGAGICMECGSKLLDMKCTSCDQPSS
ncbi:MAG: hypothetical protein ACR2LL_00660 [Nitrosopumilus sp.]|uniref:hypothetical protein n=1 Tax=Nitrosopumilus sp. TaxID=2024843 RepID=UPI00292E3687|nr:hypothetical protein [Nitrosopumilus sp.]